MKQKIGEILINKGFCKQEDIDKALQVQESYGGKIGNILLNMGVITEDQLLEALSIQFEMPLVKKLDSYNVVDIGIPYGFFLSHNVYPIDEDEQTITVATNNPLNLEAFGFIESAVNKKLSVVLTKEENLNLIAGSLNENDIVSAGMQSIDLDEEVEKLKELASEAPVIKLVNTLLNKAVESDATDIHFESLKMGMRVRFRIDGMLKTVENVPENLKLAIITRLKLLSGMNIAENRLPQDGRLSVKAAGKNLDIRASSVPTQFGESFVARLLGEEGVTEYSLGNLGFYNDHIKTIREIAHRPNGVFLTTGPTGSGKTTTLYSVLSELNSEAVKIVTVEDPIEYKLPGINQIQVKTDIDYTFAKALRSLLRQDPDIIMVGEIRDRETAEISIQASLTGHLVLSTLHTNSALASITRLLDMNIEFFLLKASIVGLMAQRLVRKLCPFCAKDATISDETREKYNLDKLAKKYDFIDIAPKEPVGCPKCNYTGYKGRTVIAEVMPFSQAMQMEFEKNRNFNDPNFFGFRSMMEDGLLKFLEGKTSLEEILRAVQ